MAGRGGDRLKEYRVQITSVRHWLAEIDFEGLLVVEVYSSWYGACQVFLPTINKVMLTIDDSDKLIKWLCVNVAKLEDEQKDIMLEEEKKKQEMASVLRRKVKAEEGALGADQKNPDHKDAERAALLQEEAVLGQQTWDKVTIPKLEKYSGYRKPRPLWLLMKDSQILHEIRSANPPKMLRLIQSVLTGVPVPEKELWEMDFHPEIDKKKAEEKRARAEAKRQAAADQERREREQKEMEERAAAASPHLKPQIYLQIACTDMPQGSDEESSNSAVVAVKVRDKASGEFFYHSQTERIYNKTNASFQKIIAFDDPAPADQVKLLVFQTSHCNISNLPDSEALVETTISIKEFLAAQNPHKRTKEIKLVNGDTGEDLTLLLRCYRKIMPGDLIPMCFNISATVPDSTARFMVALEDTDANLQRYYPCGMTEPIAPNENDGKTVHFTTLLTAGDYTQLERTLRFSLYNADVYESADSEEDGLIGQALVEMSEIKLRRGADKDAVLTYSFNKTTNDPEAKVEAVTGYQLQFTAFEQVAQDLISDQTFELNFVVENLARGEFAGSTSRPRIRVWTREVPKEVEVVDQKEDDVDDFSLEEKGDEEDTAAEANAAPEWVFIDETELASTPEASSIRFNTNFFVVTEHEVKITVYEVEPVEELSEGEELSQEHKFAVDSHTDGTILGELILPAAAFDPSPIGTKRYYLVDPEGVDSKSTIVVHARQCGLTTPLTVQVSCQDLPKHDSVHVMVDTKAYGASEFMFVAETEEVENSASPQFKTPIKLDRFLRFDRLLRFVVVDDVDGSTVGHALVSLNRFFSATEYKSIQEYPILAENGNQVDGQAVLKLERTAPPPLLDTKPARVDPGNAIGNLAVHVSAQITFPEPSVEEKESIQEDEEVEPLEKGVIAVLCQKSMQGKYVWKQQTERVMPDVKGNYIWAKTFILDKSDHLKDYQVYFCQSPNDFQVAGSMIKESFGGAQFDLHGLNLMTGVGQVTEKGLSTPQTVVNTFNILKESVSTGAKCTLSAYEAGTTTLVELELAASALPNADAFTRPDTVCAACIQHMGTGDWVPLGRTEYISESNHPEWEEPIRLAAYSLVEQRIKLQIYDMTSEHDLLRNEHVLGEAIFNLNHFLSQSSPEMDIKLLDPKTQAELKDGEATVHVSCSKRPGSPAYTSTRAIVTDSRPTTAGLTAEIMFRCCHLSKNRLKTPPPTSRETDVRNNDPTAADDEKKVIDENGILVAFYKSDGLTLIDQTERVFGDLNPSFETAFHYDLSGTDNVVLCRVWYSGSDDIKEATELLGECSVDIAQVFAMPAQCKEVPLVDEDHNQIDHASVLVYARTPVRRGEVTKCSVMSAVSELPSHPIRNTCNPIVDLQCWNASINAWEHMCRTERISTNSGAFTRDLKFHHYSSFDRKLRFAVFDSTNEDDNEQFAGSNLLGEATTSSTYLASRGADQKVSFDLSKGGAKLGGGASLTLQIHSDRAPTIPLSVAIRYVGADPVTDEFQLKLGDSDTEKVKVTDPVRHQIISFDTTLSAPFDQKEELIIKHAAGNFKGQIAFSASAGSVTTQAGLRIYPMFPKEAGFVILLTPMNESLGISVPMNVYTVDCDASWTRRHNKDPVSLICLACEENLDPNLCPHEQFLDKSFQCMRCGFRLHQEVRNAACPARLGKSHDWSDDDSSEISCLHCEMTMSEALNLQKEELAALRKLGPVPGTSSFGYRPSSARRTPRSGNISSNATDTRSSNTAQDHPVPNSTNSLLLYVACQNLKNADMSSLSDPFVVIFAIEDGKETNLGSTEYIRNTTDPCFTTGVSIPEPGTDQKITFEARVYDTDSGQNIIQDKNFLGSATFDYSEIQQATHGKNIKSFPLKSFSGGEMQSADGKTSTIIFGQSLVSASLSTPQFPLVDLKSIETEHGVSGKLPPSADLELTWQPFPVADLDSKNISSVSVGSKDILVCVVDGKLFKLVAQVLSEIATDFKVSQVAIGLDQDMWAISSNAELFHYNDEKQTWSSQKENVASVACASKDQVSITTTDHGISRLFNGDWVKVPGKAVSVSLSAEGGFWAIGEDSKSIYQWSTDTNQWSKIPGMAKCVAVGSDSVSSQLVYAFNATKGVYVFTKKDSKVNWVLVSQDKTLKSVSCAWDGSLVALSSNGKLLSGNISTK